MNLCQKFELLTSALIFDKNIDMKTEKNNLKGSHTFLKTE